MHRLQFSDGTVIEGASEKEVLDAWNSEPWWAGYSPADFRERIVELSGADVGPEQADEEILPAIAMADENITYEPNAAPSLAGLAKRA